MSTTKTSTIVTNNPYMIGLLKDDGSSPGAGPEIVRHWNTASPVTYYLTPGDYDRNGVQDWSENGAGVAIRKAFAAWQAVCGIKFAETTNGAGANMVERISNAGGNLGTHHYPNSGNVSVGNFNEGATVWNDGANNAVGSFSYVTFIHELGHGIGLEHPHSDNDDTLPGVGSAGDTGDYGLNQQMWTVMSYNAGWDGDEGTPSSRYGWIGSPMAFDIAAVQLIYGPNMATARGNNVYTLPKINQMGTFYSCIWDAGGIDTITAGAGTTTAVTINLNDATLLDAPGGGGFVSRQAGIFGGFTIANRVVIENATGGGGNDVVTGNEFNNVLSGNAGSDVLAGGAGNDVLIGGAGRDILTGGGGNDTYNLGADADATDAVRELTNAGADTIASSITRTLGTSEYAAIESLILQGTARINGTGNALANTLTGNAAANILKGLGGNDALRGYAGGDTLTGGAGNDRFIFAAASESTLAARDRILDFDDSGNDVIDLSLLAGATPLAYRGVMAFSGINQVRITQSGHDIVVSINLDHNTATTESQIVLTSTLMLSMSQSDFVL